MVELVVVVVLVIVIDVEVFIEGNIEVFKECDEVIDWCFGFFVDEVVVIGWGYLVL